MKNERVLRPNVPSNAEPKKLHKPRRELGEMKPEQVITYVDDAPCDTSGGGDLFPGG
jgi:hypothetical protein